MAAAATLNLLYLSISFS